MGLSYRRGEFMYKGDLNTYKKMIPEVFQSVGQAIGIHVMLIVLEHALWQTKFKYEEAGLIEFSEHGISLDGLDNLEPGRAQMIAYEFV
jgi:hypothetical protein